MSLPRLRNVTPRKLAASLRLLLAAPLGLLLRPWLGDTWLVSERPDQARDNGYVFFRWLREHHPEQRAAYLIDKGAPDHAKVAPLGEVVQYDSWRHLIYFCASRTHVGAHIGVCWPSDASACRYLKPLLGYRDVFLPHGVSYGVAEFCLERYAKIDLFVCCAEAERENVLANYGYASNQVVCTGFPRLDGWWGAEADPRLVVVMPTWRLYLARDPAAVFGRTEWFRAYDELLRSRELAELLDDGDLELVFYPHHEMRRHAGALSSGSPRVHVARDDEWDIQELLKRAALLVTDYSSVHFDFAYMGKPVLYYQFDQDEFFSRQYGRGLFDAERDGFGPVATGLGELLGNLRDAHGTGFRLEGEYERRMRAFYTLRDRHNCERVYEAIRGMG